MEIVDISSLEEDSEFLKTQSAFLFLTMKVFLLGLHMEPNLIFFPSMDSGIHFKSMIEIQIFPITLILQAHIPFFILGKK